MGLRGLGRGQNGGLGRPNGRTVVLLPKSLVVIFSDVVVLEFPKFVVVSTISVVVVSDVTVVVLWSATVVELSSVVVELSSCDLTAIFLIKFEYFFYYIEKTKLLTRN